MARADEPTSLIPWVPTDNASIWTLEEMYDTLLKPSVDGKSLDPALATSYQQSADKLSWTFKLRDGVKFTNGSPVTSKDVKWSISQNLDKDAPFYFLDAVITDMTTPDDHTIVFKTKVPWSPLPSTLALFANSILPANYGGKTADEFSKSPVGSGPFKFDHWTKGSELKLVKNTGYWDTKKPSLNSVTFTVVTDSNTRATQLASNQAQINEYPPYSTIKGLQAQSNLKVTAFDGSEVDYLGMNTTKAPFNDVNVRKAISQAVDKNAILSSVLYGQGKPATTFLSPATWAHSTAAGPTYDVAAAKATLAKSTQPNGFSAKMLIASGAQNSSAIAQILQSDLANIGIKLTIQTLDPSAVSTAKRAGNYDLALGLYTTDVSDPDEIARFAGTNAGGSNMLYTGFDSKDLTALADQASSDENQSKRTELYGKMQQIVLDQVPYLPLYYAPSVYSYSAKVNGFHPGATGNYFLEDVTLSK